MYRIRYELKTDCQHAGYRSPRPGEISLTPEGAQVVQLDRGSALEWLRQVRQSLETRWEFDPGKANKPSFPNMPCWKGHSLDQIRAVLERIEPNGRVTVEGLSAAWNVAEAKTPRPHLVNRRPEHAIVARSEHPLAERYGT